MYMNRYISAILGQFGVICSALLLK